MERRHPHVVNADEVPSFENPKAGRLGGATVRAIGRAAGSRDLGCSLYEVPPGSAAFPLHWHAAREEAIIVLAGTGTLRLGDAEVPVRAGDFIALPTGGPEYAHQLLNTGAEPLRYYCLSTMRSPEVVGYPDSKKVAALVGTIEQPMLRAIFYEEDGKGYFDREPLAEAETK